MFLSVRNLAWQIRRREKCTPGHVYIQAFEPSIHNLYKSMKWILTSLTTLTTQWECRIWMIRFSLKENFIYLEHMNNSNWLSESESKCIISEAFLKSILKQLISNRFQNSKNYSGLIYKKRYVLSIRSIVNWMVFGSSYWIRSANTQEKSIVVNNCVFRNN